MNAEEKILCLPRTALPQQWFKSQNTALKLDWKDLLTILEPHQPVFLKRSQAEIDNSFKQFIPYIIVCTANQLIAAYPRHGNEKRLHGRWSAGIGGHINAQDAVKSSWKDIISTGMKREIQEELPGLQGEPQLLGIINEEQTHVGKVHLGLVFVLISNSIPTQVSPELSGLQWLNRPQLKLLSLELWSQLALTLLPER